MSEAIERFSRMIETHPGNDLARFSLGKAYYDAGRHEEARVTFAEALARKPDWMVVQILLGKCELALGRRKEAKAAFAKALQLAIDQDHQGPREEMEGLLAELESDQAG